MNSADEVTNYKGQIPKKKQSNSSVLFIDVAKNDLLALKFGTNVVVVMIKPKN
jgi:hypothetical protein